MSQSSDASSQGKKRRIEEVLDGSNAQTDTPEAPSSSGGDARDTGSQDGNSSTTKTAADAKQTVKVEEKEGSDHRKKKRRVDIASAEAESSSATGAAVDLQIKAEEFIAAVEKEMVSQNDQSAAPQDGSSKGAEGTAQDAHATANNAQAPSTSHLGSQDGSSGTAAPPAKKQRLSPESEAPTATDGLAIASQPGQPSSEPEELLKHSPLVELPTELIAEILIQTGSPQHVLAIARTCKYLCHLLLSPESQFIWRATRNGPGCTFEKPPKPPPPPMPAFLNALLPLGMGDESDDEAEKETVVKLPDLPAQFFSEAAYAAFVFDSGKCEVCGNETSVMYVSFALRARLCKNTSCKLPRNIEASRNGPMLAILPTNEITSFTNSIEHAPHPFWPFAPQSHQTQWVRKDALATAQAEYDRRHDDGEYKKKYELLAKRKKEWMAFCTGLQKWKGERQTRYYSTKATNDKKGKNIAEKHGWDYDTILNHTRYGAYKRRKTVLIEEVNETDVNAMAEDIEAELLAYAEKSERRKYEINLMNNRKDVQGLYERLRSGKAHPYLPNLPTFRQLPVVGMLQTAEKANKKSPSAVDALEKNPVMKELLNSQLKKWAETAKMDFGVILGYPKNWKHASKNVLHPVERVTARFLCTRCQRINAKYREDGCLDFVGACRHECGVGNQKKGRIRKGQKAIWDSKNFVKDDKAINALKNTLQLFQYPEDKDGGNLLTKTGLAILCKSCNPPMILDTRSVVGHSHRHDNMQVAIPTLDNAANCLGGYPYEHGVVAKLLGPAGITPVAKAEIEAKNFGCRHCLRVEQVKETASLFTDGDGSDTAQNPPSKVITDGALIEIETVVRRMHDNGLEGPLPKPPPLFNFNGMRSHMKSKHGIEDIRDEDILCHRELQNIQTPAEAKS